MDAIILAAGIGERLRPITASRSKPFSPILDRSLIGRNISILKKFADKIYVVIKEGREFDFEGINDIILIKQSKGYGDGAGLNAVRIKNDFIMVYGDLLFDEESIKIVAEVEGNAMLCRADENPKNYGVVYMENGILKRIEEKPKKPSSNLINLGIFRFTPKIFEFLDRIKLSTNTGEFELVDAVTLMSKEIPVKVLVHNGLWMDIGRPWHILEANRKALDLELFNVKGDDKVREGVRIKNKVIFEDGVSIGKGTKIVGPVYIAKNVNIEKGVIIGPYTIVGHDTKIDDSATIEGSLIMNNVTIGKGSNIKDSIICENSLVGENAKLINMKSDGSEIWMWLGNKHYPTGLKKFGCIIGANSRISNNVVIGPGIKIKENTGVKPNTVVAKDIM